MREPSKNGFFADDIDLGDEDFASLPDFTGDDLADIFAAESTKTEEKTHETLPENAAPEAGEPHNPEAADAPATEPDLFSAAVAKADEKQAANEKIRLTAKLPIFSYADVKEEIADPSMTFDAYRNEKAEDFPELDDAASVTWKMVYGSITKPVTTPKKTTIAALKAQIEESKEFAAAMKKAKGDIECKITPIVTAKKKGVIPAYKGMANTLDEAAASGKAIIYVPSRDGKIYEVRKNRIGTFVAEADNVAHFDKVRAGFIPALPKIPYSILVEIIAFFKSRGETEAMANIYWSVDEQRYVVHVPMQTVSKASVETTLPDIGEEKFLLVMELHSHNTMEALFSHTDNCDETATRLYTVIGRLDKIFPDIVTRISVGGKFVEIAPTLVFDGIGGDFPETWADAVKAVCK